MIKISASILILQIVLLAKFAKLKCKRFTVIWNPQMVQDPTRFSLWQNNTNRGKDMSSTTVWFFYSDACSGWSWLPLHCWSRLFIFINLLCHLRWGPFFCKNKKKKKKRKEKKPWTYYTRILSCGRMFTFDSISWMLHVHCTWATCRTPFVNGL